MTEAEIIVLNEATNHSMVPSLELMESSLGKSVCGKTLTHNAAVISTIRKGCSARLRASLKYHGISVSMLHNLYCRGDTELDKVDTKDNMADMLTKHLSADSFRRHFTDASSRGRVEKANLPEDAQLRWRERAYDLLIS